jgi:hypothetical protein
MVKMFNTFKITEVVDDECTAKRLDLTCTLEGG